jgi:hypothetical protein
MDEVNPTNWIHGTLHPKPSGHAAIADRLTQWLEPFLAAVKQGAPANPEPGHTAFTIKPNSILATTLVDPEMMPQSIDCPQSRLDSFATLLPALDARDDFPLNANLEEPICYSRPDGTWASWRLGDPSPVTEAGKEIFSLRHEQGRPIVRIQPELPESGYRELFVYAAPHRIDPNATAVPPLQVRIVEFCNLKPGCQSDVDVWTANRIRETARKAAVPALLIWIGGWLLGLGTRVLFRRSRPPPPLLAPGS